MWHKKWTNVFTLSCPYWLLLSVVFTYFGRMMVTLVLNYIQCVALKTPWTVVSDRRPLKSSSSSSSSVSMSEPGSTLSQCPVQSVHSPAACGRQCPPVVSSFEPLFFPPYRFLSALYSSGEYEKCLPPTQRATRTHIHSRTRTHTHTERFYVCQTQIRGSGASRHFLSVSP